MMATHQGVVVLVEEVGIAEIQLERLVPARVEIGMGAAPIADGERFAFHAVHHDAEAHGLALAKPPCVGRHEHGRR